MPIDRIRGLLTWLGNTLDRSSSERRMAEEIQFHVEMDTERRIAQGQDPVDARREARLAFGAAEAHREKMRDHRSLPLETVYLDFRHAIRSLRRSPSFLLLSTLTLALAIGASTAIYTVVDGVLLRPLPYPNASDLVTVRLAVDLDATSDIGFSDRGFWFVHDHNRVFDRFGGFASGSRPLVGDGEPREVATASMSSEAFDALGVQPILGRLPTALEDQPGAPSVGLLSEGLWADRYGRDPAILGRTIELRDEQVEVIGILPADYNFPAEDTQVWLPYKLDPASENFEGHYLNTIGRLSPGISFTTASEDIARLINRFEEAGYGPDWDGVFTGRPVIQTVTDRVVGETRRPLAILVGVVALIVLIAVGNVANLHLMRHEARWTETAIRASLGADQRRLIRTAFLETLTVAALGGAAGCLVAFATTRVLVGAAPPGIPRLDQISTHSGVLLFSTCVVLGLTMLIHGLTTVGFRRYVRSIRSSIHSANWATTSRGRRKLRGVMLIGQTAFAVIVVVGALLLTRSYRNLRGEELGFDPEDVLTFALYLPGSRYPDAASSSRFFDQLVPALEALPGVEAAGAISILPLTGGGGERGTEIQDYPVQPGDPIAAFPVRRATPGYFRAMRIGLMEGRRFDDRDHQQPLSTALVSASMASAYWPGRSAVGRRLQPGGEAMREIVGVVGGVRDQSADSPADQLIYLPIADPQGRGVRRMTVVLRSSTDRRALLPQVRGVVAEIDPMLPLTDVREMTAVVSASMTRLSYTMSMVVAAALIATFLGAVGIYGLVGFAASRRIREIGIRRALGARTAEISRVVLGHSLGLALLGVTLGLGGGAALVRVTTSLLHGLRPLDPASFLGGSMFFLGVVLLASLPPLVRALRIDPAASVRLE